MTSVFALQAGHWKRIGKRGSRSKPRLQLRFPGTVCNFEQFLTFRRDHRADNVTDFTDKTAPLRENSLKPEQPVNRVQE
ncbi:MAG: hypothetical protein RBR52_11490 [Thiomonas sp.]|nr:hypothetical protein [Thiomonas sp.]